MFTQVSSESRDLAEELRILQARFDELKLRFESGTAGAAAALPAAAVPPTAAVLSSAAAQPTTAYAIAATPSTATIAPLAASAMLSPAAVAAANPSTAAVAPFAATATPSPATTAVGVATPTATIAEAAPPSAAAIDVTSTPEPLEYIKLANGRMLGFSKLSIPDPPSISFAKDVPRLVRMWDDSASEWDSSEAVLRVQGEPIALKYWPNLYRYGTGQWAGIKKNWSKWQVRVFPRSLMPRLLLGMSRRSLRAGDNSQRLDSGTGSLQVPAKG